MKGFLSHRLPAAAAGNSVGNDPTRKCTPGARFALLLGVTIAVLALCCAPGTAFAADIDRLLIGGNPLEFGTVAVGTEKIDFITLSNAGGSMLLIYYITFYGASSGQFRFCDGPPSPRILWPGQTMVLAICFKPRYANETTEDFVLVNSDDNILGSVLIPVSGNTRPVVQ